MAKMGETLKSEARRLGESLISSVSKEVADGMRMAGRNVPDVNLGRSSNQIMSTNYSGISPQDIFGIFTRSGIYAPIVRCGTLPEQSEDVPPEHKIEIIDRKADSQESLFVIYAVLQDETSLSVESEWEPFLPIEQGLTNLVNVATQAVAHKALVTRFSTRRIWKGTQPISITLRMKFEAISDPENDVILPTMRLQQLALPSVGNVKFAGITPVTPPGPSPFKLPIQGAPEDRGEEITIKIGRFLTFSSVIVKSASVTYATRVDKQGRPLSAKADMVFQTYEIYTKEQLRDSYYGGAKT